MSRARTGAARLPAAGAALLLAAGAAAAPGGAPVPGLTDDQVRSAIAVLVEEIYRRKDPARYWDPASWDADADGQSSQAGGYTALAVQALLMAGESYQDPRLSDAIAHLETATLKGTYAIAVRAHVWALLPDKYRDRLAADARWLAAAFQPDLGGWDYEDRKRSSWHDNSLAQYGALGLWEAAKRGVRVAPEQWRRLEERFVDNQLPEGGWNYRGTFPATGSMTAAGLTALFITQDLLHGPEALPIGKELASRPREAIEAGLKWMAGHFSATENPGRDAYFFYYLYGVERVGLASGYSTFGGRDWFRLGAAEIMRRLCSVDPQTGEVTVHERLRRRTGASGTSDACFALMFLSRGRVPLAFNKLRIEGFAWNNRPRDVANLTSWISQETETALNWQIVEFDEDPRTWLEAPVLYLASNDPLPWAAPGATEVSEPLARLKRYLDLGGLLFAVNEGTDTGFGQSVVRAASLLYPKYEWVRLPRDHWAYALLFPLGGRPPVLRALDNGVRELIILAPGADLSAPLQVRADDPVFPTAANLYLYASEMNRPRPRLSAAAPPPGPHDQPAAATIVRARYGGNWNPEPMCLPVFAARLAGEGGPALAVIDHPLADLARLSPAPALVVVTGTEPVQLTPDELKAVAACAAAGGVVLFETAGGRGGFAAGLEAACAAAAGVDPQEVRSLVHSRIITGEGLPGAVHLGRVDYRPYAREALAVADAAPRLRGIAIDGQPRLIFTDLDLSFGLLDQPRWRIAGYAPESAQALMRNIVLHAME